MKKANHRNLLVKPKIKVKQFKKCAVCNEQIGLRGKYCWEHKLNKKTPFTAFN